MPYERALQLAKAEPARRFLKRRLQELGYGDCSPMTGTVPQ